MKLFNKIFIILLLASVLAGCEGYQEYEKEYSESYPICGSYYVRNYDIDKDNPGKLYEIYIYDAAFDADKNLWVNVPEKTPFKTKVNYNLETLSFNGQMLPHYHSGATIPDSTAYVTIEESKIELKEWPLNDSIILKVTKYDYKKNLDTTVYILGHRTSGLETPYYDDPQGN